jgi:hypothetical protein
MNFFEDLFLNKNSRVGAAVLPVPIVYPLMYIHTTVHEFCSFFSERAMA